MIFRSKTKGFWNHQQTSVRAKIPAEAKVSATEWRRDIFIAQLCKSGVQLPPRILGDYHHGEKPQSKTKVKAKAKAVTEFQLGGYLHASVLCQTRQFVPIYHVWLRQNYGWAIVNFVLKKLKIEFNRVDNRFKCYWLLLAGLSLCFKHDTVMFQF